MASVVFSETITALTVRMDSEASPPLRTLSRRASKTEAASASAGGATKSRPPTPSNKKSRSRKTPGASPEMVVSSAPAEASTMPPMPPQRADPMPPLSSDLLLRKADRISARQTCHHNHLIFCSFMQQKKALPIPSEPLARISNNPLPMAFV